MLISFTAWMMRENAVVNRVMNDILRHQGGLEINQLAKENFISSRQMERLFCEYIGITSKSILFPNLEEGVVPLKSGVDEWLSGSSTGSCFTFCFLSATMNLYPGMRGKEDVMNQNRLGSKISEYRQNKGMTQEELAGRIGVTPQALSKWERGQSLPDVSLLADLCQILGCGADYLLGIETVKIAENNDEKSQDEIRTNLLYV